MSARPTVRLRAEPGDWLYDCHGGRFAPIEYGACAASGFVPLFLGSWFGVDPRRWPEHMAEVGRALDAGGDVQEILRSTRPRRSGGAALEMALLAYPSMERFLVRDDGAHAPFRLKDEVLWQPNVALATAEVRGVDGWEVLGDAGMLRDADGRAALRERLTATSAPAPPRPEPGIYLTGHSSLMVVGADRAVLIDPVPLTNVARTADALDLCALAPHVDLVAISHGHFDHFHVPSLLALGAPVNVPPVPRASVVCEDMAARARELGLRVEAREWGERIELGSVAVHVLPFVGEQFLTSEEHPDARNWGSCYVVEASGTRVLVAVDCGFEPGRSFLDVVSEWVEAHGPVDAVVAQAIALRTSFGAGDPDLQLTALTCAHRAPDAVELLRFENRVTLAASDVPELMRRSGARVFLANGQFVFRRGAPAVRPDLLERIAAALAGADVDAAVPALGIGEGLALDDLSRRVRLPL